MKSWHALITFVEAIPQDIREEDGYEGFTPLHIASMKAPAPVISKLLSLAPDSIYLKDKNGSMPLYWAIKSGNNEAAKVLVEVRQTKPDFDQRYKCIAHNNVSTFQYFISILAVLPTSGNSRRPGREFAALSSSKK